MLIKVCAKMIPLTCVANWYRY